MTTEPVAALGGRYVMAGLLGRGGMAEVYLGRDLRLDRTVAVKVLRPEVADDAVHRARFRREALSVAALNHPNVVAVHDTGEEPLPYLVTEFVDGLTLAQLLAEEGPLPPERAFALVGPVLDALAFAHAAGIVHRDIKPANVMVTRGGTVKVMDFGIARSVDRAGGTLTQHAMVIGTPEYLSPEQARGERVDARADLYAVGCVLYELLTGRPPFHGPNAVAVAFAQVEEEPEPPSARAPALPRACDALVLRALAKDREARFQSAAEMRAALAGARRALDPPAFPAPATGPGSAAGPGSATGPGRRATHGPLPAAGSAAAAHRPAPAPGVAPTLPSGHRAAPEPDVLPTRTHGRAPTLTYAPTPVPTDASPPGYTPTEVAAHRPGPVRARRSRRSAVAAVLVGAAALAAGGVAGVRLAGHGSGPAAAVQAPDLVGGTLADARRAVAREGLRLSTTGVGDCRPAGPLARSVCAQSPAPGAALTRGSAVRVVVSRLGATGQG